MVLAKIGLLARDRGELGNPLIGKFYFEGLFKKKPHPLESAGVTTCTRDICIKDLRF
jgi:hypothetical protein